MGTAPWSITWSVSDIENTTGFFKVYRNGYYYSSGTWNDDLPIQITENNGGVYHYTIVAFDTAGNGNADTVIVSVTFPPSGLDEENPVLDNFDGGANWSGSWVEYADGTGDYFVSWDVSDTISSSGIYDVYRDGNRTSSGLTWNGSPDTISVNIGNESPGVWCYTVAAFDEAGNAATASVIVNVTINASDVQAPTITGANNDVEVDIGTDPWIIPWEMSDDISASGKYLVYRNTILETGTPLDWTAGVAVNYPYSETQLGVYYYTIATFDGVGNAATHTVAVTVVPVISDTTDPTIGTIPVDLPFCQVPIGNIPIDS
ncbi:hypothetical protein ES703_96837 [subsurface metagenome]